MPEPNADPLALEATALRYAAGRLSPAAAAAFEARLASDQAARDALAEAVQLSAAALGQAPPAPDGSFRALIRDRLRPLGRWGPWWLARRAYRGHPLAWAGLGAGAVAAATLVGLGLADDRPADVSPYSSAPAALTAVLHGPSADDAADAGPAVSPSWVAIAHPPTPAMAEPPAAHGPEDSALKAAEIWADLSTPDHAEKTHDEDARRRQWLRDLHPGPPTGGDPH